MLSLTSRLLIAGSIILSAFLGLTGYALDQTYQQSAKKSVEDRLLGQVMTLIAAAQVKLDGTIEIPPNLPISIFSQVETAFYGKIIDKDGNVTWSSPSMRDRDFHGLKLNNITQTVLTQTHDSYGLELFNLSYCVTWDTVHNEPIYTINIAETTEAYNQEISHFRNLLWIWLGGVSIVLLVAQWIVMRWGLSPLRLAADEIVHIEQGEQSEIEGAYPSELKTLTTNLNALISSNREHLTRHRNALSDLAHSLKTPLALMRSAGESSPDGDKALKKAITQQTDQMQQIIDYQLQRAATSGRIPLTKPVEVEKVVNKIVNSLAKVYVEKPINFNVDIDKPCLFFGDESDLFEILGNLIDNAFKWCHHQVNISIHVRSDKKKRRYLSMIIEDDGPGIDKDITENITDRGVTSATKQGTGIGLAIVKDIIEAYHGEIDINKSSLGGASFELKFMQYK